MEVLTPTEVADLMRIDEKTAPKGGQLVSATHRFNRINFPVPGN